MKKIFEMILWNTRLIVLLAVILSLVGSVLLFIVASWDIVEAGMQTIAYYTGSISHKDSDIHNLLLNTIISSVDLYLIAVVLLIFSFGLYELFISKINIKELSSIKVLEIHTLDQLKDKLAKVIVMALIVAFFSKVLNMEITSTLDMIYFAVSILALSLGLYFLHKDSKH
ncbi:YqhA family protein [Helicobacter sp. faydin-H20]|uniref:YqhA family protein n=1 Tax=Helicobacter anatolicus TaxID=2905874 RepID=UPI001E2E0C35|nr:YqhA family protein [Helicobacter anatolicus]MCE3037176.1 YqhA family protein [Helicobacter anatolicus]